MAVFLLLLLLVTVAGIRFRKNTENILSKNDTVVINGLFVVLIFLSHSTQYIHMPLSMLDQIYIKVQVAHNQWVVTTFLAFSGYGIMHKIRTSEDYLKSYPVNRILKTLLNFDIAILLYIIVNLLLEKQYSNIEIIGSFIGLTSVGNSNWYIFTILLLYIFTYFAAIICKKRVINIAIIITICSIMYIAIGHLTNLPSRFYSTVCCYAFGMWIELYKEKVINIFKQKKIISVIVILTVLGLTYKGRVNDYIMNISSCFFVLFIVWFFTYFEIKSKVLSFLGKHVFSIYILQRIPWIIMSSYFDLSGIRSYYAVIINFCITLVISVLFDQCIQFMDKKLLKN